MKVYRIYDNYGGYSQVHTVVCDSMCEAEKLYQEKYNILPTTIELFSDYVIVKGVKDK